MVAEMASYGAASHLEEGDGNVPAPDQKGDLTEIDNSGSENAGTSTEGSSEEEEDEEEEEEDCEGSDEKNGNEREPEKLNGAGSVKGCDSASQPAAAEASNDREEVHILPCCEKCKAVLHSHGNERVTPRRISKGRLQVQLEGEGTYECTATGLVFEVSEAVLVRYSLLSWSKFGMFLRGPWKFAGPIFNVECVYKDSSILKSIQFPHSLCLADPDRELTFSVLHVKDDRPLVEPAVEHTGSHVKWCVSSLSPVGPIVQSPQPVVHHGVVLVYKEQAANHGSNSYSFRVYLAPNNSSDIKDIGKEVRCSKKSYIKIEKPPTCKLDEKRYRLMSEPDGEISPEDLPFTLAVTKLKGYFEAFFEQPPPFKLSLVETDSELTVWSATIREGDCVVNTVTKPRKCTDIRKRSSSASEEEAITKRARWADESDGSRQGQAPEQDMSEKQLLQVAKLLGKIWKQVAIVLGLSSSMLDEIENAEKSDPTMQKFKMLVKWKNQKAGKASVRHLCESLQDVMEDLPNEVYQTLQDMKTTTENAESK